MKVFVSWSGETSRKVALVLRDWLPNVLQSIVPYVSSEDIDKGTRWSSDISKELEESSYGIVCVTRQNIGAPWLNFEAGALSKSFDKGRVSPFLLGVARTELTGPLLQFQSTIYNEEEVLKLLRSLNAAAGDSLDGTRLATGFKTWWPQLAGSLGELEAAASLDDPGRTVGARQDSDLLAEVLEIVRDHSRILSDPSRLLPREYLSSLTPGSAASGPPAVVLDDLARSQELFEHLLGRADLDAEVAYVIQEALPPVRFLNQEFARYLALVPEYERTAIQRHAEGRRPKSSKSGDASM